MGLFNFLSSSLLLILIVVFLDLNLIQALQDDNEFGMCGDPTCSIPIAKATAHAVFSPIHRNQLRVKVGDIMTVYAEKIGNKDDIFVELNGEKGLVPKTIITIRSTLKHAEFRASKAFIIGANETPDNTQDIKSSETTASDKLLDASSHAEINEVPSETIKETSQSQNTPSFGISASPTVDSQVSNPQDGSSSGTPPISISQEGSSAGTPPISISQEGSSAGTPPISISQEGSSAGIPPISSSQDAYASSQQTFESENEFKEDSSSKPVSDQIEVSGTSHEFTPSITNPANVNSQQTYESEDKVKKDFSTKPTIDTIWEIVSKEVNKTVNILSDYQSTNVHSTSNVKPTESPSDDQDIDLSYEETMRMLEDRGFTNLSDSLSPTNTVNLPPIQTDMPSSNSIQSDHSQPNKNEDSIDQTNSEANHHSHNPSTESSVTNQDYEHDGESKMEENVSPDSSDDYEEELDEDKDTDEDNEDDPLVTSITDAMAGIYFTTKPDLHASVSYNEHMADKSNVPYDSDSMTFSTKREKEEETSKHETTSTFMVPQDSEKSSNPSPANSSDEVSENGNSEHDYSFSAYSNESSNNPTNVAEEIESLLDTANGFTSDEASDSSTHAIHRHILEDGSGEEDKSTSYTTDENQEDKVESVDAELQPGLFSIETLKWAVESCWNVSTNFFGGLKAFLDMIIAWLPEPLYSWLISINVYGLSIRAVVFTAISVVPTFLLFATIAYIMRRSKENQLTEQLCDREQKLYRYNVERNALLEENNNLREQVEDIVKSLDDGKSMSTEMKDNIEKLNYQYTQAKLDIETHQETISCLCQENEDLKKKLTDSRKKFEDLSECLRNQENNVSSLSEANEKMQDELDLLVTEKQQLVASEVVCKEKISSLEQSCKQLLQEAEIWNKRVNELREQVYSEAAARKEAENLVQTKDNEIETLKTVVTGMEALKSLTESGVDDKKTLEDSMQSLMDAGKVQTELKKSEELNESLSEKLKQERNKVLEMEVELLESKSEVDKLKVHYNQALQDKAEAQTKLDVLTKYFKDKELQLQKELGVQEAFRQRKEEDATHAERRIHLIEEENSSYKFQVASLKQEIEETERNLKNQIANQEKKAHENWLAARNAERKMEEIKQESTQLRQRLTLLEREQEKWLVASQNDVIRPVPQRLSDQGREVLSTNDGTIPLEFLPRHIPPPPLRHPDDVAPPFPPPGHLPMPLPPPGRPILPPPSHSPRNLPPPMMPSFMPHPPPFDPLMPGMPPHRPVPWSSMTDKRFDLERRKMPSEFDSPSSRRNQTPPRSDSSRRSVSPTEFNSRSRSSSPSVPLPDFHNTPPRMGRPDIPPPGAHMRFVGGPPPPPPHLMHRRDYPGASPYRDGNRSERLTDEGSNSSSRTRNFTQPRQASEEEV